MDILERVAAGDEAAVKACVDAYGDLVWSLALRILGNREDAEEVVQDVFVELWRHAARFDPAVAPERAFVTMIARRRILDRRRRQARNEPKVSRADLERLTAPRATDAVELSTEARLAARAVERLGDGDREVLLLASYYGHTHREIAEHLDLPLGTVKTRARRALMQVRDWLLGGEAAR